MSSTSRKFSGATKENLLKLQEKLRELFQLDRGDLDFGLYRIMKMRAGEVEMFLSNELLPQAKTVLAGVSEERRAELEKQIAEAHAMASKLSADPETMPGIKELRQQQAEAKADADAEADVYNHLANFFARYYAEGDFMPQRRYSSGGHSAYLIPYDGEEVKLHWANADQYYIKTTENYASYAFTVGAGDGVWRVRFEMAAADNEQDNIKAVNGKHRRFLLAAVNAVAVEAGELMVRFAHRPLTEGEKKAWPGNGNHQQSRINETLARRILEKKGLALDLCALLATLAPTDANGERTVLAKHLERYTAKNSFDYFIHKDLGGFLRRELDLYLKSEVLNLDDLPRVDTARLHRAYARTRAVRHIGEKIIDFLAQLEDFQKRLWLKKKFVLATWYCVTLDKVPEELYAAIAGNDAQRAEWVELFAIDELNGDLADRAYSAPLTTGFLKDNPHLVLDTRHFDEEFVDELLAGLSAQGGLDEQLDGLLVHGENFQALNLLQARYRGEVKCVHIDPPYNTDTSGFVYKNNYRHSSWLAMMRDRIVASSDLLSDEGSFLCHIDENEYERLHILFDEFSLGNAGTVIWDKRNPVMGGGGVATQHEYIIVRSKTDKAINLSNGTAQIMLKKAKELVARNNKTVSEKVKKEYADWVSNRQELSGGEKAYRNLDDNGAIYQSVSLSAPDLRTDPKFFVPIIHPVTNKPCAIPSNGFSRTPETLKNMLENDLIIFGKDHTTQPRQKMILSEESKKQLTSVVSDATRGKAVLDSLGLGSFPYSHSVRFYNTLIQAAADSPSDTILDYFAGSGTTAHAVINLNREDGGKRKYILVELGHHFENVLLPRVKKAAYSKEWKDGKPRGRQGISQLCKCIRIESYEDTLDNLELTPLDSKQKKLLQNNPELAEDYHLRYAVGEETAQSASLLGGHFTDPFSHKLSVVRDGARYDETADLPETFNFLLGLRIHSRQRIDGVLAITGMDAQRRACLILWRNIDETDNSALDNWLNRYRQQFPKTLDLIYANGDHSLGALEEASKGCIVKTIEPELRALMFARDASA